MRKLGLVGLVALLGCKEPPPPLEDVRVELLRLDGEPLPDGWAPQATVVVSETLLEELIARYAKAQGPLPDVVASAYGVDVTATPVVKPPKIDLSPSDACPTCIRVDTAWEGAITLSFGLAIGTVGADIAWRSGVGATVTVEGAPKESGFQLQLLPFEPETWSTDLDVAGLPAPHDLALERTLASRVQGVIHEQLSEPMVLADVPQGGEVRLRGLRTKVDKGLAVDLGFSTVQAGEVPVVPDPREGFAVVLPAKTLLGVAQAAVVRHGAVEGYLAEPTAFHVDGDRFSLELKIWKQARREKWRNFLVDGQLKLERGQLSFVPDRVVQLDKQKWSSPMDPIVKKVALDALEKACAVSVPAKYVQTLGSEELVVELIAMEAKGDVLTLWGDVR